MPLKQRFLHPSFSTLKISRVQFLLGILIGLLHAFFLYAFLYLTREAFRMVSITDNYDLWVLTDKEVHFYNLFFAFLASIIGQSACFSFWINQPRSLTSKSSFARKKILHDQRVLNWVFLSWYSKLGLLFGILFGIGYNGGFYTFSFYPNYNYLFILIILVLFFQTWNSIRSYFKQHSFKWMILSMLVITIISIGLSNINFINYNSINKSILSYNVNFKYQLDLVGSNVSTRLDKGSQTENIFLVSNKEQEPSLAFTGGGQLSFDQLSGAFNDWFTHSDPYDKPTICLYIHKETKMYYVNRLKSELIYSGLYRIAYPVVPNKLEYDQRYYHQFKRYFHTRLPYFYSIPEEYNKIYKESLRFKNKIEIKQKETGETYINSELVPPQQIKDKLTMLIHENLEYIIYFHVNDKVSFENYFKVLSASKEIIYELRDRLSYSTYQTKFNLLDYEERRIISKQYVWRVFEITDNMLEKIEQHKALETPFP